MQQNEISQEYIYRASASKRITANQLGSKVYQSLKFQFFYYVRAMLKTTLLRYVTSRDTQFILIHDNSTPIGTS